MAPNFNGFIRTESYDSDNTHYVQITGKLRINGRPVSSVRAVELLHLVASNDNQMSRNEIELHLYRGYCARSSLWYPLKVCQKSGVDIRYSKKERTVFLYSPIKFDYDLAMHFLEQRDLNAALWILNGWPVTNQAESYFEYLLEKLRNELKSASSHYYWSEIEEIFESIDRKCQGNGANRYSSHSLCVS